MSSLSLPRPVASVGPKKIGAWVGALAVVGLILWGGAEMAAYEASAITLEGVRLPDAGDPEPFVRQLAQQWHATELTVDAGSQIVRATRREMGGSVDVDVAVEQARVARGDAPIWTRVWAFASQRERDLRWRRDVAEPQTHAFVEELRDRTVVDPEPSDYDGSGGRSGTALNLVGANRALVEALRTDALVVRLPVRQIEAPTPRLRSRRTARFTEVVSAHETRYSAGGNMTGRAQNVELAAELLDGQVIAPRSTLSFNDVVGERTFERGFAPAIELARGGRRTEGIGGGICQVAATLHAAAFFAGFDIEEHHPHTRNSVYIPAGLDSAVSWPNKDLVIRNTHPFHVRVRSTAYRGTLRIELMGARRAPRVEWNTRVVSRIRAETEVEVVRGLPMGDEEVVDEGEDGSILERTRTVYWDGGARTDTQRLRYPMVTRLVRRGPSAPMEVQ